MTQTDPRPAQEGPTGEDAAQAAAERIPFGRNPRHFGIDPGEPWPADVPLDQDDTTWRFQNDPIAAKKAERKVGACFMLTLVASLALCVVYVIDGDNTQLAGLCWGLAFLGLGAGLILWARDLMPGNEVTASRGHHDISSDPYRVAVAESFSRGLEPMVGRRSFIVKILAPAGGLLGLASLFPLASLGPRPHTDLFHTKWRKGTRLVTEDGKPIRPGDVAVNGIVTVFPEGNIDDALSPTLLINVGGADFRIVPANRGWNIPMDGGGGLVAFSKICTHAGCPASLYNQETYQLVCPCHASQFDILLNAKPVFGPASRSLPQLPIAVNQDGYLVAQSDYTQPVGPGFWDR